MGYRAGAAFMFICSSWLIEVSARIWISSVHHGGLQTLDTDLVARAVWSAFFAADLWLLTLCALNRASTCYHAELDLGDKQRLFNGIARRHCKFGLLEVDQDCDTIKSCNEDFTKLLGTTQFGDSLGDLIVDCKPDVESKTLETFNKAKSSSEVKILMATIKIEGGNDQLVELFIAAKSATLQRGFSKFSSSGSFLVGVCSVVSSRRISGSYQDSNAMSILEARSKPEADDSQSDLIPSPAGCLSSVAFNNNGPIQTDQFHLIMEAGRNEHWIFEREDINYNNNNTQT
ncbi:unnamed protein product [Polarella glacialis]|uniref:PAS domain-containing protein n=1 Tax=Polarella glacialis TaxID=89957 RepID=A0A813LQ58_POLGL|nr:unnamed protein product [Polarella glacialis]